MSPVAAPEPRTGPPAAGSEASSAGLRWTHPFGAGRGELGREDKRLLGGKGANLAEMARIGLPVPPGFTITTEACLRYLDRDELPDGLESEIDADLAWLEEVTGRSFGDGDRPLLLSVRSGAAFSMPGMMDTILNLGLNDRTVEALAREAGDPHFAWDCYRRFLQMYGEVVLHVDAERFEGVLTRYRESRGASHEAELPAEDLKAIVGEFRRLLEEEGAHVPDEPRAQLLGAVNAVFRSWNNDRARAYRRVHHISDGLGTAVNVMTMVYGNLGAGSGTGVAFTRDPATGEKRLYGEFLVDAQGEDVVAGIRDPLPLEEMEGTFPEPYVELQRIREVLEEHYRDMQDLEFTVERGTLWMLQTRTGKRTAAAAVKIAVDMVDEGLIDEVGAVRRVDPDTLEQLLHPQVDPEARAECVATGLPASPGAATGRVALTAARAREWADAGEDVILVRQETSPDDFDGMVAALGIVTARGGMTSHAAVVARGMGTCCVAGAGALDVREAEGVVRAGGVEIAEGDWITVDGTSGRVLLGRVDTVEPEPSVEYARLMRWADHLRILRVRANADTAADAERARENGAEGIGLCRTEHMFLEEERLEAVREMILAGDAAGRRRALERILPLQRQDFLGIFRAMDGLPVTIRLLDPPLHEFLPAGADEIGAVAKRLGVTSDELAAAVARHRETNPMLGHRGVRLGTTFPEITEMQARAILEAAAVAAGEGVDVHPEIMVPLVATVEELRRQVEIVRRVSGEVREETGVDLPLLLGTMIELPRAALVAGEIAREAEFFSFGTNDLTQTTFGLSRDDSGTFLPHYLETGILRDDPFRSIDRAGVGRLVRIAVEEGRGARADLHLGVCGEHGGDPRSVEFFHEVGLHYVSCSPFRVPVARLAAARAAAGGAEGSTA